MRDTRKRLVLRIMTLLLGLFFLFSHIDTVNAAKETDVRNVKAGIFQFDGYHAKEEDGSLTGYGIEFLKLVARYSNLEFSYTGYERSWNDMLTMLEAGEIDMVTSARKNTEREAKFAFSYPIGRNSTLLKIRADDTRFHTGDYRSYNGMKIGLIKGSSQNAQLEEFAQEKNFSYRSEEYDNMETLVKALKDGEIDSILSSNLRKTENERTLDTLATDNFYVIVRKDDAELLKEINYAIEQMNLNEGDWTNTLFYKYYGAVYSPELSFNEREQKYIEDVIAGKKKIMATASVDRAPYAYVEDGQLKGIIPDYFKNVMALAGLPYEIYVPKDREDYYRLLGTDAIDVVIDNRLSDLTEVDDQSHGFTTNTYLTAGVAKVTRRDFTGEIQKVAVARVQGTTPLEKGLTGDAQILEYETREDVMQAVLNKEADAAFVYTYAAQMFINNDYTEALHYHIVDNVRFEFGMHIRAGYDHELVTILDKCIRHMPEDAFEPLVAAYTASAPRDLSVFQYLQLHPEVVVEILLVLVLITGVILVLSMRARWSRKVLAAMEQANKEMGEQLAIVEALSRDYVNVYALNIQENTAKVIKLEGYVTTGLRRDYEEAFPYEKTMRQYVKERVYEEDKQALNDALSLTKIIEKLKHHVEYTGTYRIFADGEIHNFQFICIKAAKESAWGEDIVFVGFRNIDEMVREEQKQKEILAEALEEAKQANRAKTRFLNNMSHDIRTPMNAIIGFTSLASGHMEDKTLVENYLDKIMTASRHLLNLINDVLDMSRIESGKVSIVETEVSLSKVANDLKTIVQSDIKTKHMLLNIDITGVMNDGVICDKLRLNQVLLNLLSNAIKYTKPGGTVSFGITQTDKVSDGSAPYLFTIKDTGIGMSEEFLKHAFEPFEREQTATTSGIQGTGLGLAITKNIVDMMKGTITAASRIGEGSEFSVSFRFRVADGVKQEEEVQKPDFAASFQGKRILLVEDNEINQEIAKAILEEAGFEIDIADDGTDAVGFIEGTPHDRYDLILMDVQMPIMDGYEATRHIRSMEDPAKAAIPIVAMTANAFEEDRQLALAAGMNGHVAKPIDVPKLMALLGNILAEKKK